MESNMEYPLLSVIVPVYKAEQYLDRCVESIVNQTYHNLEVILVNDGSPDKSGELCDVWAQKDSRIRVLHQNNAGAPVARNNALKVVSGEWIGFIDSDDYLNRHTYEWLMAETKDNRVGIVGGEFLRVLEDGSEERFKKEWAIESKVIIQSEEVFEMLYSSNHSYTIHNKVFRKSLIENITFPAEYLCEDYRFTLSVALRMKQREMCLVEIPRFVYYYTINTEGYTNTRAHRMWMDWYRNQFEAITEYTRYYPKEEFSQRNIVAAWKMVLAIEGQFDNPTSCVYNKIADHESWRNFVSKIPLSDFFLVKDGLRLRDFVQFITQKYFICVYHLLRKLKK